MSSLGAPFDEGFLQVSKLHLIHYVRYGNPDGKPVVVLHGGPGSGIGSNVSQFFDGGSWHIIAFSQRGSGKSSPHAETAENTTQHLIGDIEQLRVKFGIDKWTLFGNSWGSTLSLAYAQAYPERCVDMIIGGIFLARKEELIWDLKCRKHVYPDAWDDFSNYIPVEERSDLLTAYAKRLSSTHLATRLAAARAWNRWELTITRINPGPSVYDQLDNAEWSLAHASLEVHYFTRGCFLEDGELLRPANIGRIRHIPCIVLHGRYDMVCPLANAWDLKKAWPELDLRIIPNAGHSFFESVNKTAVIKATEEFESR